MKKIILAFTVVLFFAACGDANLETKNDSVGTAKDSSMYQDNILADTPKINAGVLNTVARKNKTYPVTTRRTNTSTANRRIHSSNREVNEPSGGSNTLPTSSGTGTGSTNTSAGTETTANTGGSSEVPQPEVQKKGWSNAAKGAAIGGVAGAIGGAIISKKKGKGAIIGGIIGAGGGYVIGRAKDRKDGRVQK